MGFEIECLVVDGGSEDDTIEVCGGYDVRVVTSQRGRGHQLLQGATEALGSVYLFLHADCRLTPEHCIAALRTAQGESVFAGAFHLTFDDRHPVLRLAEFINRLRFRFTRIFYGDHGIFLKRENYEAAGGFRPQALFEDVDLSRRMRKLGKLVLVPPAVITSARRFRAGGVVRTYLKMASLHILDWLGVSHEVLARWYQLNSGVPKKE